MGRPQARAEAVLEGWPTEWRSGERTLEEVSLQGPEPRTSPSAGDVYRLLALRLQAVREEERARLARELHDQLGGLLTGIKVDLGVARHRIRNGDAEGAIGKVEDASRHVDLTIQATRRIATDLRPAILDHLGVVEALEFHAREFQERTGIDVRVLSEWGDYPLHTEQRTALFRIVQECLTNVVRHARASAVTIALKGGPVLLTLSVTDNGAGFSPSQHRVHSLGLLGMTERARAVNATLSVDSAPGAGTRVTVQLRTDGK